MEASVYTAAHWPTLEAGQINEWSVQNGAGAYAGSTIVGAPARRHHGLLTASLCAPVQRFTVWQYLDEALEVGGVCTPLSAVQFADGSAQNGWQALRRFTWNGLPTWEYAVPGAAVEKTLALQRGRNTAALAYRVTAGAQGAVLHLAPCFCWRPAGDANTPESLDFAVAFSGREARLTPAAAPQQRIRFYCSLPGFVPGRRVLPPAALKIEAETGDPRPEPMAAPFALRLELPPNAVTEFSLVCTLERACPRDAFALVQAERRRQQAVVARSRLADPCAQRLALSADQFLVDRRSTGGKTMLAGLPWFTDWGRDTMIAFEGCCLCTRRFAEARSILATFAHYEKDGLVPNMFPDEGTPPLYNTVDASLWYVCAAALYDRCTGGRGAAFLRREVWPCIRHILAAYEQGTGFSIGMDPADALIHAGGGLDQVTWMDVRVGDWVATPRHGKPVEINALWYAALCIGADFAARFGEAEPAAHYAALARRVRAGYAAAFWNPAARCLYDVIGPDGPDDALRPNQLLAVSLWRCLPKGTPPLLSPEQEAAVVHAVQQKLYVGVGLRTLPPDHPDYHPRYLGPLAERDAAYHQGTAWGWPLGEFLFAHRHVHGDTPAERAELRRLLAPALAFLYPGQPGGVWCIAEIFDAEAPHAPRGCFNQAWSVGEVLAALCRLVLE